MRFIKERERDTAVKELTVSVHRDLVIGLKVCIPVGLRRGHGADPRICSLSRSLPRDLTGRSATSVWGSGAGGEANSDFPCCHYVHYWLQIVFVIRG